MRAAFASLLFLALASPPRSQATLPAVDEVAYAPFRAHVLALLGGLEKVGAPLPMEKARAIRALLEKEPRDPEQVTADVQKVLDAHCLVGVHINPESRVKAARGPWPATLVRDKPAYVLVRVHNEGGVTHPLAVHGSQIAEKEKGDERWLECTVLNEGAFGKHLNGRRLEYRVLKLVARQGGKREATLAFDVGQGTEDLGFRAEVPILFTVKER